MYFCAFLLSSLASFCLFDRLVWEIQSSAKDLALENLDFDRFSA